MTPTLSPYYSRKAAGRLLRALRGKPPYPRRYLHIEDDIRQRRPRHVLEIGTNDGLHAVRMSRAARDVGSEFTYHGFDLFEHQGEADFLREFSLRTRSLRQVDRYLRRHGVRDPHLVAGDSTVTLPREAPTLPPIDLAFIDGGHSLATVEQDWRNVQPLLAPAAVVYFDDYPNWGIGPVVDAIDRHRWNVRVMPNTDRFHLPPNMTATPDGWMDFQVVRVERRA